MVHEEGASRAPFNEPTGQDAKHHTGEAEHGIKRFAKDREARASGHTESAYRDVGEPMAEVDTRVWQVCMQ